jgi:hypothetical protein
MKRPSFGEANIGALVGSVVGSVGGLFTVGLVASILYHDVRALFAFPKLGLIGFFLAGVVGWLLGGQVGPRLGMRFHSPRAELIGGILSGLFPVLLIAGWAWYMVARR